MKMRNFTFPTKFLSRIFLVTCLLGFILNMPSWSQEFDNTNVLVEKAVNNIYQRRFQQAYDDLKAAYEKSPRHPGVHFNLGRLYELTGNFPEALKEYQITVVLDPSMVAARRGIGRCSVELKRPGSIGSPGRGTSGIAVSQAPFVTQSYSRQTTVSGRPSQGNIEAAMPIQNLPISQTTSTRTMTSTLQPPVLPSKDGGVLINRPDGYALAGLPSTARPLSQPAAVVPQAPDLSLPPMESSEDLPSVEDLRVPPLPVEVSQKVKQRVKFAPQVQAESQLDRGDASRAIQTLQTAAPDSDNPDVQFTLGKAFMMKGDLFSAIKHLEEAIRVDEQYSEAYYLLAQNYAKVNLLEDAIKNYLFYFAVKPQAGVAVEIGRTYERMGKTDLARQYYAKANAMNPGNPNLQSKLSQAETRLADDMYFRGNQALTTGDFAGAVHLFDQALSIDGLDPTYEKDARRKAELARFRAKGKEIEEQPAKEGFETTRKIYGTVNLQYPQLADIKFHTNFTEPITVEWRGFIARSFRRYGRDFLLLIKELSQDELDIMSRDRNDYRLNPNYNNQPIFLLTAKQGELPSFAKEGKFITFTGTTDWKRYDVINELGQTVKLPAFEYVSAHP